MTITGEAMRSPGALVALALFLTSAATEASAEDGTGVTTELERTSNTRPEEKIAYAHDALEEIRTIQRTISRLSEAADKKSTDSDSQDCVKNALRSVNSLLGVAESASLAMPGQLEAGNSELADFEFSKIAVALTKSRQLLAEAEGCASGSDTRSGQTSVKVEGGLSDGSDDTQGTSSDVMDYGFDPPDEVSPF